MTDSPSDKIHRTDTFIEDAVAFIADAAQNALSARGKFRLSLCGGGTPRPIYEALAKKALPWADVVLTFGDERCFPPTHERSNYRMVKEALLDHLVIPQENVIRMEGERPPSEAAERYEAALREHLTEGETTFRHDLILLGLGDDGHTASLFPGTPALEVEDRWIVANHVAKFDEDRLTFTYPLINAARHVAFLLRGEAKRPVYEEIFRQEGNHPAGKVRPQDGDVTWIIGTD